MDNLLARYRALPRAARWALLASAGILFYFVIVEPTLDATNRLTARADQLAAGLRKEAALKAADSAQGRAIADGLQAFGQPVLPTDRAATPDAIHRVVDAVLTRHGITKRTKNERLIPIRGDEVTSLLGQGTSAIGVDRLVLDVSFEASPETVVAIVSELEQAREITAIARVEMRKAEPGRAGGTPAPESSSRTVKATISPESWIASDAAGGAR